MQIKTAQFGEQAIDPTTVIEFPLGLLGFEASRHFKLFHQEGSDEPLVFWLQSIEQPEAMFSVADPTRFGIHYELEINDAELALLGTADPADLAVLILLYKDEDAGGQVKGTIHAPLVLDLRTLKAMQKILPNAETTAMIRDRNATIEVKSS